MLWSWFCVGSRVVLIASLREQGMWHAFGGRCGRPALHPREAHFRSIGARVAACATGHPRGPIAGCPDARTQSVAPVGDEFGPNLIT